MAEILINVRPTGTRIAYVEGGTLTDLKVEKTTSPTMVGSIHRGKVLRVLPGMQAAFVDIGLDRAAFLYVGDVRADISSPPALEGSISAEESDNSLIFQASAQGEEFEEKEEPKQPIQELLREGQSILVQVAKDPLGTKGARITTHISLPGRNLVYMPTVKHFGISRRIEDEEERERLLEILLNLKPEGGAIVRTAGEGATEESLKADLDYSKRLWKEIYKNYEKKKTAGLVHAEMDIAQRALRDLLNEDVSRVIIDDEEKHRSILRFASQFMPRYKNKIEMHQGGKPLFDLYDLDLEISRSLGRKVWLKSGGYIVIDEAEALVVIDINTGRYVGKRDLEDTILKTNLEAVKEIAHQLRIRNCGGIIIIDFIDMEKELHREQVMELLKEELTRDRAKTKVLNMSELGLVEMTRKRIRPSLVKTLCEPCAYCDGRGYVKHQSTVANEIFRDIEREGRFMGRESTLIVHCHADVADWVYEVENEMIEFLEKKLQRSFVFKVEPAFHVEQYELAKM